MLVDLTASPLWRPVTSKPTCADSNHRAIEVMPLGWFETLAQVSQNFVFFTKDILTKVVAPLIFAQAAMPERESAKCRQALKAISVLRDPICRFSHVTKVADITSA